MLLTAPCQEEVLRELKAGQKVLLNGVIYTGRDAAHQKLSELLARGEKLPLDLQGQIIYYVGPAPARPGQAIGSAGPTTAGRMDAYTPDLLAQGLKVMIGKGKRSPEVKKAMLQHGAVYLAAVGGAAALIAQRIKKCEVIAYPELGTEAIHRLEVENFPAIVINDLAGNDLYEQGRRLWEIKQEE
ncbi:MAG: Fe-S-containing hydro-lyase [Clostridia bacterium]|nr:Fe-S-containing hydro-lyase [Clostridia bacterium]